MCRPPLPQPPQEPLPRVAIPNVGQRVGDAVVASHGHPFRLYILGPPDGAVGAHPLCVL